MRGLWCHGAECGHDESPSDLSHKLHSVNPAGCGCCLGGLVSYKPPDFQSGSSGSSGHLEMSPQGGARSPVGLVTAGKDLSLPRPCSRSCAAHRVKSCPAQGSYGPAAPRLSVRVVTFPMLPALGPPHRFGSSRFASPRLLHIHSHAKACKRPGTF